MKYTWTDLKKSYTNKKRATSSIWARMFSRPVSFVITYVVINMGISANQISMLSIIDAIASCVFISLPNPIFRIIGVCMFALWHILDCVDGNIARVKKESSYRGEYIDALSGYTASSFIYFAIGIAAFNTSKLFHYNVWWIIIGGVAAITEVYTRLIHQRFTVAMYREQFEINGTLPDVKQDDPQGQRGVMYIGSRIRKLFGFSALFIPFLIVSCIFNRFDILVGTYMLYNTMWMLVTLLTYIIKSARKREMR